MDYDELGGGGGVGEDELNELFADDMFGDDPDAAPASTLAVGDDAGGGGGAAGGALDAGAGSRPRCRGAFPACRRR